MNSEKRFSALNTKIRVLKSKSLNKEDYINLINLPSIKDQVAYLKSKTIYEEDLKKIGLSDDIENIETALKGHIVYQYKKMIPYLSDAYKKLFKTILLRYEIEDLKLYLRAIERNENLNKVWAVSFLKDNYYNLDFEKLKKSRTLNEFIENLEGTIYYKTLKPYIQEEHNKILFYMEMNLDRLYFNLLKENTKALAKVDRIIFEETLGKNIDLLNIEWIYRGIKFYNLLPEELINFTLFGGYEFNYEKIREMSYSSEENLRKIVLGSKYEFLFDTKKDVDLYMERRIERYLYYQFMDGFKKGKMDISLSMAYIHLLEYEIRDIISILESKRYGLTLEQTKEYLVRKIEGSDE
jgi:V/A-type H+-transporting ATPase subunit C